MSHKFRKNIIVKLLLSIVDWNTKAPCLNFFFKSTHTKRKTITKTYNLEVNWIWVIGIWLILVNSHFKCLIIDKDILGIEVDIST